MTCRRLRRLLLILSFIIYHLSSNISPCTAQIKIGGSVYGGGNAGAMTGNTKVQIYAGDINNVFGGAAAANVGGSTHVIVDGEHMSDDVLINHVYGGNDREGTIGAAATVPTELEEAAVNDITPATGDDSGKNTKGYNAFVQTTKERTQDHGIFIGQLFGGGNQADLSKTYLELKGGTIAYAYGGGNNATVTQATDICIDNDSHVTTSIPDEEGHNKLLDAARLATMGIISQEDYITRDVYHFSRVFGGNNKAEMTIRPTWHLYDGNIENLYSGGNQGDMTHREGILLEIPETSQVMVHNVYGGCRMSNVRPQENGQDVAVIPNIEGYKFPTGLSARVLVRGGTIDNVYGGNDITGHVWGGTAVGIYTDILGNVYGGGNGSYSYTDNAALKNDRRWGDYYYDPVAILGKTEDTFTEMESATALNSHRPNVEQVSIRINGKADDKTNIYGAIYLGGNSATLLKTNMPRETVHLKIGSHATADNVFLGNNGEQMVATDVLERYAGKVKNDQGDDIDFSSLNLTNANTFAKYMEGSAMQKTPAVVFDNTENGDPANYEDYTTAFGSFYCGGNQGSMVMPGQTTINFNHQVVIYDKLVGGCNDANIPVKKGTVDGVADTPLNAAFEGGFIGAPDETVYTTDGTAAGAIKDRMTLNLEGLRIEPKRWKKDGSGNYVLDAKGNRQLEWNTISSATKADCTPGEAGTSGTATNDDKQRRFMGGNVYGGCYISGHVNGNVVINLNGTIVHRDVLFDDVVQEDADGQATDKLYDIKDAYTIRERRSGVAYHLQGMDALGQALNVFGGGYGENSEVWGSTTVNLNKGFTFQIFGGGENGAIGHGVRNATTGKLEYATYDPRYSTHVSLNGASHAPGAPTGKGSTDMAEAVFIYGGGFEGPIAGNTTVRLDNGRLFNSFAGSCNADILGHTETYVGENGFPYVTDHIYGGNDLGGRILAETGTGDTPDARALADCDFTSRVRQEALPMVYGYNAETNPTPQVLTASAYMEYRKGHVGYIFGGHYGDYDYTQAEYDNYTYATGGEGTTTDNEGTARPGFTKPRMGNAFVNFRPDLVAHDYNAVSAIYGGSQGHTLDSDRDIMQERSYVLVDAPQTMEAFKTMPVFGAGAYSGLGMEKTYDQAQAAPDRVTAVIDLVRGQVGNVYGGSYQEGVIRRTMVNVPQGSTISTNNIFGGAYGTVTMKPCDVYESNVNFCSGDALVAGALYGGNNNERRTLYTHVNISAPLWANKTAGYRGTVYGAGNGGNTWAEYTEVNLNSGAEVWEVYGGGNAGSVQNSAILELGFMNQYNPAPEAWRIGSDYDSEAFRAATTLTNVSEGYYMKNKRVNLENSDQVRTAEIDDRDYTGYTQERIDRRYKKYNTNVIINEGATVHNYAYGGGYGETAFVGGSTYVALLGGTVKKDIYAAGTSGAVEARYGPISARQSIPNNVYIATANAYIKGGTVRNVYGGGWKGAVGYRGATQADDVLAETHVVIGDKDGTSFTSGIPTVQRNAYGGGEGGAVWGTTHITLNNGYIGYEYDDSRSDDSNTAIDERYTEKIVDETWKDSQGNFLPNTNLAPSGCVFGGGYIDNSMVDNSVVRMYGGYVRNALFGGGEVAAVGRGTVAGTAATIEKAGTTSVKLYDGHVLRNVFGGGRGYNNLGEGGSLGLGTDGYVFGKTEVDIYGGVVGTDEGMARGYGNVFGGGDIGFVYSGNGQKQGKRYDGNKEGYYYTAQNKLTEDCKVLVEPHCQVKAGQSITLGGNTYEAGQYVPTSALNLLDNKNTDADSWNKLDTKGIIIHNAVFAGGNTSSGSDKVYANTTTVYGNVSASIHDAFHRDLITIGTGHTGGLYGDGNLTFVDGYRELNITNYGTDFYYIANEITSEAYHDLSAREAAYYELKYKCIKDCKDIYDKQYHPANDTEGTSASTITTDELIALFEDIYVDSEGNWHKIANSAEVPAGYTRMVDANGMPDTRFWEENGVMSRYAGRIMNTIQRADFCGVFGSRMVMQGAQDRVPETVDYTNYTINRVREVSLNKNTSTVGLQDGDKDDRVHGNYFGIYNIVNYLGNLTSDLDFGGGNKQGDVRTTDNTTDDTKYKAQANGKDYGQASFYDWKAQFPNDRRRNNGNSHNKVALASGVYLEIKEEAPAEPEGYKWGYITGVVELDLINVHTGVGGGFVYAKNEHGLRTYQDAQYAILTELNHKAVTRKDFTYADPDNSRVAWETSGNFVHSTQTIIDDCYPISNRYLKANEVAAHYWYIKGSVYVYDQYISAYTGSPNAYSETVNIPLTITAASHGSMTLMDIKPNLYAYYSNYSSRTPIGADEEVDINNVTYRLNSPISYWDWYLLKPNERRLFVSETYVTVAECKIGDRVYPEGYVMLPDEYNTLKNAHPTVLQKKEENGVVSYVEPEAGSHFTFDFVFRSSNNLSHNTGYILTYDVNNPANWNDWYTKKSGAANEKITKAAYDALQTSQQADYDDGPTYRPTQSGLYGQLKYKVGNLIAKSIYDTYQNVVSEHSNAVPSTGQAVFEPAYIVTKDVMVGTNHDEYYPGAAISKTFYDANTAELSSSAEPAYICTRTIQIGATEYIYAGAKMTQAEKDAYKARFAPTLEGGATNPDANAQLVSDINNFVVPAYYCTTAGNYGGNYYDASTNYRGLDTWSSMSPEERTKFTFNYDALDVLIDHTYSGAEGQKYQYDGCTAQTTATDWNKAEYSLEQPVDYTATYDGTTNLIYWTDNADHTSNPTTNRVSIQPKQDLSRTDFERIPNEQRNYSPITVVEGTTTYYVVNTAFQRGDAPYAVGNTLSTEEYNSLGDSEKGYITTLDFTSQPTGTYFYCREPYKIGEYGEGKAVTGISLTGAVAGGITKNIGDDVPVGMIIKDETYNNLVNKQKDFTIHGIAPTETSTLYVSRNSDIFDLSTEKIITVIYKYDYEESNSDGTYVTPYSERHVVNIHLKFESGIPTVEDISAPRIVLPGTKVALREPHVTPGAYEVTGGGWELFSSKADAEAHTNGKDYTPVADKLYWYQDGYYAAYYAKTYLGKTYSNAVPVSVANYHDLAEVMSEKKHHMYVDHEKVKRDSKIYIGDYRVVDSQGQETAESKNGLTMFKDLFDLSVVSGAVASGQTPEGVTVENGYITASTTYPHLVGDTLLNPRVKGGAELEFFLHANQQAPAVPSGSPAGTAAWTSIASGDNECFEGNLHGDGYYISGLDHSLFDHLCGNVYNLGVTGSFTGAGIAETGSGYVENCWVSTSSTEVKTSKPVFGNPTVGDGTRPYRIVNSYYMEDDGATNPYTNHSGTYGTPTKKPARAFYNGEVAYDLNGFYLYKRYKGTAAGSDDTYFFTLNADGSRADSPTRNNYGTGHAAHCSSGYVEDRYADGDFRYAGGTIPDADDERLWTSTDGQTSTTHFSPIWPDDYLFFGQMLTYGYDPDKQPLHETWPSHNVKSSTGRLPADNTSNRVYRSPAYFRSKQMGVAHFNPWANLAARSADGTRTAYPGMTAIDLTGYADAFSATTGDALAYGLGQQSTGFYPPLLDTGGGLTGMANRDLTQNLLVYTPQATETATDAETKTNDVVTDYLLEPVYAEGTDQPDYRTVERTSTTGIHGHAVERNAGTTTYSWTADHLLVDRQDFNAPIAYTFESDRRMWYQRVPDTYVDRTKGWEGISLPFTAELVTTHEKGEITHFYSGSDVSKNGTGTKIGHEYWLRELTGDSDLTQAKDAGGADISGTYTAEFNYPSAVPEGIGSDLKDKEYANTFLWDRYYHFGYNVGKDQKDKNEDDYQEYYSQSHTYSDYAYYTAAKPYIAGFPGATYYEFDLSGTFSPRNTYNDATAERPVQQTITFASVPGTTIQVSDDETQAQRVTVKQGSNRYVFRPSYLNETFSAGTTGIYTLNAEGSSYDAVPAPSSDPEAPVADTQVAAFRPYFQTATGGAGSVRRATSIAFSLTADKPGNRQPIGETADGTLDVRSMRHKLVVSSTLRQPTEVMVITAAGATVARFTIEPGQTVEQNVVNAGVYIVQDAQGRHTKKLVVR